MLVLISCCICGFAAMVHGAVGIGFPLIATPLLAMVTDVRTAILLLVLPTVVLNIANILKGGHWRRSIAVYWPLAAYGAIGSMAGAQLLLIIPAENFRPLLAAAILLYLNAERVGVGFAWVRNYPHLAMALFGVCGGILGGTVNVMLPALVIFALEAKMEKTSMIQVFNFCFLFGKLTQGAVFLHAGYLTPEILKMSLPLAGLSVLVMFIGLSIRSRLNEDIYKRWLKRLLLVMALVLVAQFSAPYVGLS